MRASAILQRFKNRKVPNKRIADEIAHYINNKCTNDTLFRLLNPIGQLYEKTNHSLITQLITNEWDYIRTYAPLIQNLHEINQEHNNWTEKLFGSTGKNYKIALISSFFSLLSLWINYWLIDGNSVKMEYAKIIAPNCISIGFALVPGLLYAIFTHSPIRDIVISLLSPFLVSFFNFIIVLLALTFGLFLDQGVSIGISLIIGMALLILVISLFYYYNFKLLI